MGRLETVLYPQVNGRLKLVRQHLGYTQMEMAKLLQTDQSNYSRSEAGLQNVTTPILYHLLYITKVNPMWLIWGEGGMLLSNEERNPHAPVVQVEHTPHSLVITTVIARLN